jgi:hypothetical protein
MKLKTKARISSRRRRDSWVNALTLTKQKPSVDWSTISMALAFPVTRYRPGSRNSPIQIKPPFILGLRFDMKIVLINCLLDPFSRLGAIPKSPVAQCQNLSSGSAPKYINGSHSHQTSLQPSAGHSFTTSFTGFFSLSLNCLYLKRLPTSAILFSTCTLDVGAALAEG